MGRLKTVLAVTLFAGATLAGADNIAPFGKVELRTPSGKTFHAQASVDMLVGQRASSMLFAGDGFFITVPLPEKPVTGAVQVPATLQAADQVLRSSITLEVKETEPVLSAKLSGKFGALSVNGELHVPRPPEVKPAPPQL